MRKEAFGNRLKFLRELRGITQQQLADQMSVSRSTVANWETGNRLPDINMVVLMADCLGVETALLINELEAPETPPQILMVDDLPALLPGCVRMLKRELPEAEVTGVQTVEEALSFARETRVSVAILY